MRIPIPARIRLLFTLLLLTSLAGCVSTKERYEKGRSLEAEGRYAEAARNYIRVLRDRPGWQDTRADLEAAGAEAVDRFLDDANAAEAAGDYERAVEALAALDDLRNGAAGVGVTLPVPADYDDYRREMTGAAADQLVDRAEAAEAAGRWADALRAYERVAERYAPGRRAEMDAARARVFVRWSEHDLAAGHFRAAYDRAGQALQFAGPDAPPARLARELQADALAAGTRYVAFLPSGSTDAVARHTPRDLLHTLDEVLEYEYWADPPLFVAAVDPAALHRELRRLRPGRDRLSERQAAEVGRAVDADDVVLLDLTAFTWEEKDLKTERRAARTRGRGAVDTVYTVERYRVDVRGEVAYAVVDPRTRAVVERGTVRADASDRFERGRYAGNPRDLDLGRRDRDLFDEDALEDAEHALEEAFVDRLAERVAARVYETLGRRVR